MTQVQTITGESFASFLPLVQHVVRSFHIYGDAAQEIVVESFLKVIDSIREGEDPHQALLNTARALCLQAVRNQKPPHHEELPELGAEIGFWFDKDSGCSDVQLEFNNLFISSLLVHYPIEPRRSIASRYYLEAKSIGDISGELKLSTGRVLQELLQFRSDVKYGLLELKAEAPKDQKKPQHLRVI